MRADEALVHLKLLSTRSQAKEHINASNVFYDDVLVTKPSQKIQNLELLRLGDRKVYVGRGGYKLEFALDHFQIDVKDKVYADIGASTGGFTQVLLDRGAKKVYAIDVGHDQFNESLLSDKRVENLEGVNIRDFPDLIKLPETVEAVAVDLSFISLKVCLENIISLFENKEGELIFLFKPQFEVGAKFLNKQGIVKDEKIVTTALSEFIEFSKEKGLNLISQRHSPIAGKKGNQELLLYFKRTVK